MGHIVRPPSRGADSVDSGLLSLVEHEQYNKTRDSPRYNNPNNVVGIITNCHNQIDSSPSPSNSPIDALSDLIASLSNGSDKQSPNSTASAWQVLTIRFIYFALITLHSLLALFSMIFYASKKSKLTIF